MNTTHLAATLTLVASSFLAFGCGGDKSSSSSGAVAGATGGTVATCQKKGVCTEYRNAIPDLSEDLCKGTDGNFVKGSGACPTDKLMGNCVNKLTPDSTTYYYGGPEEVELTKGLCEALDGKWTSAGAKAAASGTPAAAGTGASPAAAGTGASKAPAAPATPAKAATPAKPPAKKK